MKEKKNVRRETVFLALEAAHYSAAKAGLELVRVNRGLFVAAVTAVYEQLEGPASKAQKDKIRDYAARYIAAVISIPNPLKGDGPGQYQKPKR